MKKWRFHQFVHTEKGPQNTAIIDFLKGNVFQVSNDVLESFIEQKKEEVIDLISELKKEDLVIKIEEKSWIPRISFDNSEKGDDFDPIELEFEEGADLERIQFLFNDIDIKKIVCYGRLNQKDFFPHIKKEEKKKNFSECYKISCVTGDFPKCNRENYSFNKKFNSCWGKKMCITKDGVIRPCIYSQISIANIFNDNIERIFEKIKMYWELTKDKVEVCKYCELRYVCFDCREIARIKTNDLYAKNPYCQYNPIKGIWVGKR